MNDLGYFPNFEAPLLNVSQAEEATVLCGNNSECLFDFSITGNKKIAQSSMVAFETFSQIQKDTEEGKTITDAHDHDDSLQLN